MLPKLLKIIEIGKHYNLKAHLPLTWDEQHFRATAAA